MIGMVVRGKLISEGGLCCRKMSVQAHVDVLDDLVILGRGTARHREGGGVVAELDFF